MSTTLPILPANTLQNLGSITGSNSAQSKNTSASVSSTSDSDSGELDISKFLDKFSKIFGADAAKDIQNSDGSIDFNKVKGYIEQKLANASSGTSGTQTSSANDPSKILHHHHHHHHAQAVTASSDASSTNPDTSTASTDTTQGAKTPDLAQLLFGSSDSGDSASGSLISILV